MVNCDKQKPLSSPFRECGECLGWRADGKLETAKRAWRGVDARERENAKRYQIHNTLILLILLLLLWMMSRLLFK